VSAEPASARLRVEIRGAVQGVGFRPFVYRLASELAVPGWVINDTSGVRIEVEGPRATLERFLARLGAEAPPAARIQTIEHQWLEPAGLAGFEIRRSDAAGEKHAVLLPELATCADCLAEIRAPLERRHRYPFTNCTACGPRFSIIRSLPYDRPNTTMAGFTPCPDCLREYRDPHDRRFHAQPIACPACGPQLALWDATGAPLAARDEALGRAAAAIAGGHVVAVKGLGGFHLVCDAADAAAVGRLRDRKPRRDRPFAVMCADLDQARALVDVDDAAAAAMAAPEAPIVLLPRRAGAQVAGNVAPGLPTLGVMLAYSPLHHLLLAAVGRPVVATSGNLADEPIAVDGREAVERLGQVADLFLTHDRPIERHVDDSVGWFSLGAFRLLRRARGFAPLPVRVARPGPCVLAVGPHLKNTVALALGGQVFLSQHIGDLETPEAEAAFERVIADFLRLYEARPAWLAHDLHPDYVSTRWATAAVAAGGPLGDPPPRLAAVQHHHAHLAACLAEHGAEGPALGVTWDGTGFGTDATVWGGEFLLGDAAGYARVGHLAPFRLPGGEAAVHEPRRVALALLWETLGPAALGRDDLAAVASFGDAERTVLARMMERGVNAPSTTSAGRLFDGLAALLGLHPRVTYEGQAAIALEFAADAATRDAYPVGVAPAAAAPPPAAHAEAAGERAPGRPPWVVDWRPMVVALLEDLARGVPQGVIAARAHGALVAAIVQVAGRVGERRVALSGGCFQNRILTERTARALEAAGHEVLVHRRVPPNDGGVSLGQAAVAAARAAGE
jgi:hydrogenase maturation protein HypF